VTEACGVIGEIAIPPVSDSIEAPPGSEELLRRPAPVMRSRAVMNFTSTA
jgi:hypothetical protein